MRSAVCSGRESRDNLAFFFCSSSMANALQNYALPTLLSWWLWAISYDSWAHDFVKEWESITEGRILYSLSSEFLVDFTHICFIRWSVPISIFINENWIKGISLDRVKMASFFSDLNPCSQKMPIFYLISCVSMLVHFLFQYWFSPEFVTDCVWIKCEHHSAQAICCITYSYISHITDTI